MQDFIVKLQTTKITRRQFLVYCGLLLLTVSGISGLMRSVKSLEFSKNSQPKQGFGSGSYGA